MKLEKIHYFLSVPPLIILIVGALVVGVNYASAVGNAYFPQDTTVALTVGNIVIEDGSDADEVTTNSSEIIITISSGQTMTMTSSGKLHLSNNGSYSFTCSSTESRLVVTSSTTKTITVTPTSTTCDSTGGITGSGGGGGGGGGGTTTTTTPTPTPIPTVSPTTSPVATPVTSVPTSTTKPTPASQGFISLAALSLKDGDVISAAGSSDPDVYIVNVYGYKRLFLNPAIFNFYGHLGGFSKIKSAAPKARDTFVTSGLFRNCETNDKKVYGVEITGEDIGTLHWVNTTGDQAVKDDPNFFKKVFCINTKEFSWYPQGVAYTSVNQIPDYSRKNVLTTPASSVVKKYKVSGTDQLNVRSLASTSSTILGKIPEGQIIESLMQEGVWHKIKYQNKDAWVHGSYLKAI